MENSTVENNIFYTNNTNKALLISSEANPTLSLNYNLYYSPSGSNDIVIEINGVEYNEFSSYQTGTSQDLNSNFSNPLFTSATIPNPDLHINTSSPAINAGNPLFIAGVGETDMDGEIRVYNGNVDCGADEYGSVLGIINLDKKDILIYPNPTKGVIYVDGISDFCYKICSLNGQLVNSKFSVQKLLDLTTQAKGLYLVKIYDKKGLEVAEMKVIKE